MRIALLAIWMPRYQRLWRWALVCYLRCRPAQISSRTCILESSGRSSEAIQPNGGEMKVGIAVYCNKCGLRKAPRGRSAPMIPLCRNYECAGYYEDPRVGDLWPGGD